MRIFSNSFSLLAFFQTTRRLVSFLPLIAFILLNIIQVDAQSRREQDFKALLTQGNSALDQGNPEDALALAQQALAIPGYENDPDAQYLEQLATNALKSLQEEKTVFEGSWEVPLQARGSASRRFVHPRYPNTYLDVTFSSPPEFVHNFDDDLSWPPWPEILSYVNAGSVDLATLVLQSNGVSKTILLSSRDFGDYHNWQISGIQWSMTGGKKMTITFSGFEIQCVVNYLYNVFRNPGSYALVGYGPFLGIYRILKPNVP